MTLQELTKTNTGFFARLQSVCARHKHPLFKWFLRDIFTDSYKRYIFKGASPELKLEKTGDERYIFVDEVEKIECVLNEQDVDLLHNLLKNDHQLKRMSKENKTLLEQLNEDLKSWLLGEILDKPFVTYDIETTYSGELITDQYFEMAYSVASNEITDGQMQYKYIDRESMMKYCDYLLAYPGYIVGYNQIRFDNPVLIHNCGYGPEELEILNQKSLDLMVFVHKVTGKRMKLNMVAQALISSEKTLSSGAEWTKLLKEYKQTGDKKILKQVKDYCKQDVVITLWVLLYFLKYQKIYLDGDEFFFTIEQFMQWSNSLDRITDEHDISDTWWSWLLFWYML